MTLRSLRPAALLALLLGTLGAGALLAARTPDDPPRPTPGASAKAEGDGPRVPPYRMTGTVRVEGTGEPVAGARIDVYTRVSHDLHSATTGPDGRFEVALPPGNSGAHVFPPPGYLKPEEGRFPDWFDLTPGSPVARRDYTVRRGTGWTFRVALGKADAPARSAFFRAIYSGPAIFAWADDAGEARLTLSPGDTKGDVIVAEVSDAPGAITIPLAWAAGFRPDAVKSVERREADYRLVDEAGRVATLGGAKAFEPRAGRFGPIDGLEPQILARLDQIAPSVVDGKLTIGVILPEHDPKLVGDLAGRVVDEAGRPVEGARVVPQDYEERSGQIRSLQDRVFATTGADGRFLIRSIARRRATAGGAAHWIGLTVTKPGRAGVDVPGFEFKPGDDGSPHVVPDIVMSAGATISGTVVGPDDRPVAGVRVYSPSGRAALAESVLTDDQGRFAVRGLPAGKARIVAQYGAFNASGEYPTDARPEPVKMTLRPAQFTSHMRPEGVGPTPPDVGSPAPAWDVAGWGDGKARSVADYRGRVVVVTFSLDWSVAIAHDVARAERLRARFGPRGVDFLMFYSPEGNLADGTLATVREDRSGLPSAADNPNPERIPGPGPRGATARRYGIGAETGWAVIDREGKVAFASDSLREPYEAMLAAVKARGLNPETSNFDAFLDAHLARQIERALERR
jgi:hypothetical protein